MSTPGKLIIIAAPPGMGKTAFALNLAINSARRDYATVAIFSLGMSAAQIGLRMLGMDLGVDLNSVKIFEFDQHDWDRIAHGQVQLNKFPPHLEIKT